MKNVKKILVFCFAIILSLFSFVGCNCNEEETEDQKYLRLYDLDMSGVVDEWERPYNYNGEIDGVKYNGRNYNRSHS